MGKCEKVRESVGTAIATDPTNAGSTASAARGSRGGGVGSKNGERTASQTSHGPFSQSKRRSGTGTIDDDAPSLQRPFKGLRWAFNRPISLEISRTFWETSTQDNLTPEASDRPETRLELLTITSSIRICFHFLFSSRMKVHSE